MKQFLIFIILVVVAGVLLYVYYQNSPYSKGIKRSPFGKLESMVVKSKAFLNNEAIPSKYTCDGINVSPPLSFSAIPTESKSLVLFVDDPDSPSKDFTHWIIFDINPLINGIEENSVPESAVEGLNDFGEARYGGPCPPNGTHRYIFKLYALDTKLGLEKGTKKNELLSKIQGHILDEAELTGVYEKQQN